MEFVEAVGTLGVWQVGLLLAALVIAFGFEVINGFHDTANAVATVIYTRSLKPTPAVVWSGLWNFIGVHAGGIGVAFSIVHLLPADLLVNIKTGRGMAMVLSLLGAAIIWNFATWYRPSRLQFPRPRRLDHGRGHGQRPRRAARSRCRRGGGRGARVGGRRGTARSVPGG